MGKEITCGQLRATDIGRVVTIKGWVNRRRDHGGLIFIDLRDRWGLTQVVFNPSVAPATHEVASQVRSEYVMAVTGTVGARPAGTENPNLPTGEIEVMAQEAEILNASKTPPFYVTDEGYDVDEMLRLKYRYLDLRRPRLQRNIALRHRAVKFIRDYLDERGFLEIETPILIKSTPEGARDYLVPSRIHPGEFYALPQSPQQLKQLLMVSGFERYFQIAKCFRDEDLRADRQPEFTQLDLEMSFVDQDDVLSLTEGLYTEMVGSVTSKQVLFRPFPQLTYAESMERFGSDKPDMRFGMEIVDLSDLAAGTEFQVFKAALGGGGAVRGIAVPSAAGYTRREIDELTAMARQFGAKGLVTVAIEGSPDTSRGISFKSSVSKFVSEGILGQIADRLKASAGDLLLIVADQRDVVASALGRLRSEMGKRLVLLDPNVLAFAWIVDPPLLEWKEEERRWDAVHHPFTAPNDSDVPLLDTKPGDVRAKAYDLVCNGYELASGSIRIHKRELQSKVFSLMGYGDEEIDARFGQLLGAFEYGAPPHGGIAPGIDRTIMLLAEEESIREVVAFPKTQSAIDLMMGAPSPVPPAQLDELHISLALPEEAAKE